MAPSKPWEGKNHGFHHFFREAGKTPPMFETFRTVLKLETSGFWKMIKVSSCCGGGSSGSGSGRGSRGSGSGSRFIPPGN